MTKQNEKSKKFKKLKLHNCTQQQLLVTDVAFALLFHFNIIIILILSVFVVLLRIFNFLV